MLYVEGRKSFEVRSEKKIITLSCAKNNTRQTIEFAVCKKKCTRQSLCRVSAHGKVWILPCAFFAVHFRRGTRQSISLPCVR